MLKPKIVIYLNEYNSESSKVSKLLLDKWNQLGSTINSTKSSSSENPDSNK